MQFIYTYVCIRMYIVIPIRIKIIFVSHIMVQLASKFTSRIGQHMYLARRFVRHDELHAFDTRVSSLHAHATIFASYATHDLYVRTNMHSWGEVRLPAHKLCHAIATCTRSIIMRVKLQC